MKRKLRAKQKDIQASKKKSYILIDGIQVLKVQFKKNIIIMQIEMIAIICIIFLFCSFYPFELERIMSFLFKYIFGSCTLLHASIKKIHHMPSSIGILV